MISWGSNFPDFDFTKNNLDRICIGLYLGYSEEQLMREISISQVQWKNSIDLLYSEGLIKKEEERYVPTFPVIAHESGQHLYQLSIPIGNDIVSLIKLKANRIQQETLWKNGKLMIPVLNNEEYQALHRIANLITADMINLFEGYRSMLVQAYHASLFDTETSFEEYFIWYYHFLYSYVTDQLIELKRYTIAFFEWTRSFYIAGTIRKSRCTARSMDSHAAAFSHTNVLLT